MKVTKVVIRPVRIPRKESQELRYGRVFALENVYVAVHTDDGVVGYGEACPVPPTFGDSQEAVVETLKRFLVPSLLGKDPMNIRARIGDFDLAIPGNPSAKAALDIALHDIVGKALGVPVSTLLGGRANDQIPVVYTVGIDSTEKMKEKALIAQQEGYSVVKIKGSYNIPEDMEHLRVLRKAMGENGPWLRLDPNKAYVNPAEMYRYIPELETLRIVLIEEPFPEREWEAYRALRDRIRIPVLLDESIVTGADIKQVARSPEGFVVNVKIQKSGGLFKANQLVTAAQALQIPVMIGSLRDSTVSNTAGLHLASTIERLDYACDQRYAWGIDERAEVVETRPKLENGAVKVPDAPGLGINVIWEKTESLAVATLDICA